MPPFCPQPFVWPYPVRLHGHLKHQSTLSAGYLHVSTNVPGSDDLNGINVKYRYEFTDTLGMVTSFSYAGDKNRQLTHYSDTRWHEDSVRNRWFSVMAGPSVRVE
ncbi:outer membrane precursor Lom [Escherichia coli]|nr:outer membrane precursor Lom [Escherichia coli]